jgi:hypothetical protein
MIKTMKKPGIVGMHVNIIKVIYEKATADCVQTLWVFSRLEISLSSLCITRLVAEATVACCLVGDNVPLSVAASPKSDIT